MKTLIAILLCSAATAYGAVIQNPFVSNSASAYPSGGQVPVWGGTAWTFGSGGSATNLSPWSEDINAANFSLTNASTVSATNITGDSTIARTNANHFALSVTNNSVNAVTFRGGINLIDATVTATMVPDSQSVILEPAGSGNLPDFIFYTNGNFRFPGVAINGFGRTLQDYIDVSNAITNAITNGHSVWYGDGSHLTGTGSGGSATNLTPWPSDINGAGHSLTNVANLDATGMVGIGTTAPSHTLHIVTATNNAVGIDSTGTDSASMLHIHNYAGTQGPFFDFGSPPGEWGLGMSSLGSFLMRFTQNTNTDPVNGSTLFTYSTNGDLTISGVYTGNASGLTNLNASALASGTVPAAVLPSTLNLTSMTVSGSLVVSNGIYGLGDGITNSSGYHYADTNQLAALSNAIPAANVTGALPQSAFASGLKFTNDYYFHTNATTGQWGYWDTNGVHFESNFLSGVWWWRGPTNSMSGVATTTNFQTDATTGNSTNTGSVRAGTFYGNAAGLTNGAAVFTTNNNPNCLVFDATVAKQLVITNASFSILGFSNTVAGRLHSISICVSNSNSSAITITGVAAARYIGAVSTNALSVAAAKQAYYSFDIWPGVLTNCANVAEQ